jgi:hypothetical protein
MKIVRRVELGEGTGQMTGGMHKETTEEKRREEKRTRILDVTGAISVEEL